MALLLPTGTYAVLTRKMYGSIEIIKTLLPSSIKSSLSTVFFCRDLLTSWCHSSLILLPQEWGQGTPCWKVWNGKKTSLTVRSTRFYFNSFYLCSGVPLVVSIFLLTSDFRCCNSSCWYCSFLAALLRSSTILSSSSFFLRCSASICKNSYAKGRVLKTLGHGPSHRNPPVNSVLSDQWLWGFKIIHLLNTITVTWLHLC